MKTEILYKATGLVYGHLWGGGKAAYPARPLEAKTKKELIKQAVNGLDGSLDSGMGYESLIGALLQIDKYTTIEVKGKLFTNTEYDTVFVGKLTAKEKDFLIEAELNY